MIYDATIARFDKASAHYQTDSIKYRKRAADRVSQLAAPDLADVMLDIGCGTGAQLMELAGRINKGIGIDISPGMIQRANGERIKSGLRNLEFHVGDFITPEREVCLHTMKISKIISNYALHHLSLNDKKQAVEKMIALAGDSLERIVIGDLMFFDNPKKYANQYSEIGYGPGTDLPCYADELSDLFDANLFAVTLDRLHPLVGVLKAVRKRI